MPDALPARRALAAVFALLALAAACLAFSAPAHAQACTTDGGAKVCVSKLKESCSPGPPYRCRTARNECRFSAGKLVKCEYSARRRVCKAFGGQDCSLSYKTFCSTTTADKRCRTDSATVCSGKKGCKRTVDNCHTFLRTGHYACSFTEVVERCTSDACRTTKTTCKSGTNKAKKCFATFSSGASGSSGADDTSTDDTSTDDTSTDDTSTPDDGTSSDDGGGPAPSTGA